IGISKPVEVEPSVPKPTPKKLKTHGEWWIYDDDVSKSTKARVHRGTCIYCNHGKGVNPEKPVEGDRKWRGPYPLWREAWKAAQKLGRAETTFCKKCCGKLNEIVQKDSSLQVVGLIDAEKLKQSNK
ncbi:MAG: hypothetical protein GWO20_02105, partial [Candidatus Korarchaeota archaeon]|nr:hypothetical protein [Candidatus Korarchaeota archaeon]NIU84951.1 hypothetical protein [Candidatus Thorarchaeota archaeon]NIW12768.1 hypothetical protein [Candidatus Thorarchaeota archaeon]NIW50975.1 hypothetical protein [Candidatus Korarchaeota archaeon]